MQKWSCECILDAKATLGEAPSWLEESASLLWVDIEQSRIGILDLATCQNRFIQLTSHVGVVVPTTKCDLLAATFDGFVRVDLESGETTSIVDPESAFPRNRFNDGKCDPRGRFWAGSISYDRTPGAANLYALDAQCQVERKLEGVSTSNGLAWSEDESTFYFIDTPLRRVDRFDYDAESGNICNRQTIIEVPEQIGKPDGMTIDREGMLWLGMWGGSSVTRWNPYTGEMVGRIAVPAERITSCCFGGPNYTDVYITSARTGLSDEALAKQPLAGGVFRASVGVAGYPCVPFAG
ncbi:MAG: SMP-30/gluconolactonase/LRE family protein [Pirellulaceae bacterium]